MDVWRQMSGNYGGTFLSQGRDLGELQVGVIGPVDHQHVCLPGSERSGVGCSLTLALVVPAGPAGRPNQVLVVVEYRHGQPRDGIPDRRLTRNNPADDHVSDVRSLVSPFYHTLLADELPGDPGGPGQVHQVQQAGGVQGRGRHRHLVQHRGDRGRHVDRNQHRHQPAGVVVTESGLTY
eukprot:CAMPEP_0116923048 /NCGR_PEP_ID=MMETSP0467-20121206/22634_1 /TAXON_ID=283647 /ORGANISM="Mesodinium pulex, Strain SPMC105" /LENGTH=178 /DNA_ID=CAMNT_0004601513 /DNA_START=1907 /DNA_END=2443 /DNA_ORIENTATION=-